MTFDELVDKIGGGMVQEYFLPHSDDTRENALPGQFVYENNDSDTVIGFVSMVSQFGFNICLFDAKKRTELPEEARPRSGAQDLDWVTRQLEYALQENPAMREHWITAVNTKPLELQ